MPGCDYAIIMAGGKGSRFWPASREAHPKQLLPLFSDDTMIGQTVQRLSGLFAPEKTVIVSGSRHVETLRRMFPAIPPENILGEPVGRNTAPCMAMACAYIKNLTEQMTEQMTDPVLAFFPADHAIGETDLFRKTVKACLEKAQEPGTIVTIGITPDSPHTGYGYIELAEKTGSGFHRAARFREKPDEMTAKRYLDAGNYRWNGGMFFLTANTLCGALEQHAPEISAFGNAAACRFRNGEKIDDLYRNIRGISIDYAVMEHAEKILVADAPFSWDDVGAWTSLRNHLPADADGNRVQGKFAGLDVKNCILIDQSNEKDHLIAAVGVTDLVVIHTPDATLICPSKDAQRISELVDKLNDDIDFQEFL